MGEIGAILLAAGSSSRMSGSKQMLHFNDESLLRKSAKAIYNLKCPAIIVLGHNYNIHYKEISDLEIDIVSNPDWGKGMGNSLKFGLNYLQQRFPELEGAIIALCDQPFVNTTILRRLKNSFENKDSIVVSFYNDTTGPPLIFGKNYFNELLNIEDQKGAKYLVEKYEAKKVKFPEGAIDIDTDEDWEKFNSNNKSN